MAYFKLISIYPRRKRRDRIIFYSYPSQRIYDFAKEGNKRRIRSHNAYHPSLSHLVSFRCISRCEIPRCIISTSRNSVVKSCYFQGNSRKYELVTMSKVNVVLVRGRLSETIVSDKWIGLVSLLELFGAMGEDGM